MPGSPPRHSNKYAAEQQVANRAKHDLDAARAADDNTAALDAGARYNQSRDRLNSMELVSVKADPNVNRAKSFTAGYENECKGIDQPIIKAAKWRCKQMMVIRNSNNCVWPSTLMQNFSCRLRRCFLSTATRLYW